MIKIEVYVIYKDGEVYRQRGKKTVYLKLSSAKQVITTDSKDDAETISFRYGFNWYELSNEEREELVKQAKQHYQIRIFKDIGEVV